MFPRPLAALLVTAVASLLTAPATAHFLVVHTPKTALLRGEDLPFHLIFTHAFAGGPSMAMDRPERFYFSRRPAAGEPSEEVDLLPYLQAIDWQSEDSRVPAWRATIPRNQVRSLGDYQFVVEPAPYLEAGEDIYIQQFAKVMVNVGGVPGNWSETLGLPAEIHALNKPYANWTGGVFRGVVLSDGVPVPFTQIEVEHLNHALDVDNRRFEEQGQITAPHPSLEAMVILSNAQGEFSFALPKAGWWGFAALNVGPTKQHAGKPLSQDAILWVQVTDLPP
jgi:cobalt/nickel transport protein